MDLYAPILAISSISIGLSVLALVRGAPAQLAIKADSALRTAQACEDSMQAFRAEMQTVLGAIEDERERTVKAQARGRAQQQRLEQAEANNLPQSRNEVLSDLRRGGALRDAIA